MFLQRKAMLFQQAMEMSASCQCDVAVFCWAPGQMGQMYQYTSSPQLVDRIKACKAPVEALTNGDLEVGF